jgi:hypothetical protein
MSVSFQELIRLIFLILCRATMSIWTWSCITWIKSLARFSLYAWRCCPRREQTGSSLETLNSFAQNQIPSIDSHPPPTFTCCLTIDRPSLGCFAVHHFCTHFATSLFTARDCCIRLALLLDRTASRHLLPTLRPPASPEAHRIHTQ